mgnify:CR=1 FL=1
MYGSLEEFLEQVARRESWFGGGSVAALAAALAAALTEKLAVQPGAVRRLRRIRRRCLRLVQRDAETFARVIAASRHRNRASFHRRLKTAIEVPWQVFESAQAVAASCRVAQRSVKPQWRSDLRCALSLANASAEAARALISTNLTWLGDPQYSRTVRHRLAAAERNAR